MERDEYRDDTSSRGMQAQAAKGTPAERVQAVIADEGFHHNEEIKELVASIRTLVKSIALLVLLIGVALIYMVLGR